MGRRTHKASCRGLQDNGHVPQVVADENEPQQRAKLLVTRLLMSVNWRNCFAVLRWGPDGTEEI